jgi:type III restriction enzyme
MTAEMDEPQPPRNAVDNPILNSPFHEPARHFDFSGPAPRIVQGRRAAGYHGVPRTEQTHGAIASHAFLPLPLANEIRERVRAWRERGYPNVTTTTRDLVEHWNRADRRPLFFCQREAVETIIWLTEGTPADRQGIEVPTDIPNDLESAQKSYGQLRRYCAKMATGSGKTIVMGMVCAWSILNKLVHRQDTRFSDAVLIVGPNLTVKERLRVLDPNRTDNYYDAFDLLPRGYRDMLSQGRVFITNWHAFAVRDDDRKRGIVQRGRESDAAFVRRVLGRDLGGSQSVLVINDEAHHAYRPAPPAPEKDDAPGQPDLSADEKREVEEFAEEATVWVGGLDRINKVRGIRLVVDLSATPFYLKGTGYPEGSPLPWTVSDFGLVDAIESGITKVPRVPVADDSGRPDPKYFHLWRQIMTRLPQSERETNKRRAKPEAVWREAQGALTTLADKWQATAEHFDESAHPVPPCLIVVAANTALAGVVADAVKRGDVIDALSGDLTFAIDSKVLAEAEVAEDGGTVDKTKQLLRLTIATVGKPAWPDNRSPEGYEDLATPPGKDIRCVVSVGMLTEGWDASNVTQILGLRAFSSQLLCEQVVGRGLRRMSYDIDPATGMLVPEYCDVFGIPFEVIPVQGTKPAAAPRPPPSTLVQALEERKQFMIEFPRVEGYVRDVKARIRCNVAAIPALKIEPQIEPTAVVVRTQMGWTVGKANASTGGSETLRRERFYEEHRVQRTAFEISRDITEVLSGRRAKPGAARRKEEASVWSEQGLFPQVLAIVERYIADRVTPASAARVEEIALARYRDIMLDRLLTAIEPDVDEGEAALLPRIDRHRPIGSTSEVQFRTNKPTKATTKSHLSHVVLDSLVWEGAAAFHLEQLPFVLAYAKNDRLDFEILYEWQEKTLKYIPDFLAVVEAGDGRRVTVILEMKGFETEQDRAKWAAAMQWVRAVNNHGGFGLWDHRVCKEPNALPVQIEVWRAEWRQKSLPGRKSNRPPQETEESGLPRRNA